MFSETSWAFFTLFAFIYLVLTSSLAIAAYIFTFRQLKKAFRQTNSHPSTRQTIEFCFWTLLFSTTVLFSLWLIFSGEGWWDAHASASELLYRNHSRIFQPWKGWGLFEVMLRITAIQQLIFLLWLIRRVIIRPILKALRIIKKPLDALFTK